MQTGSGKVMFLIQHRDLLRVRNVSDEEIGLAGIIPRLAPKADIVLWGQMFEHCGMHKEWQRDQITVEKLAPSMLSPDQTALLNRRGHLNASELELEDTKEAPKPVKKAKKAEKPKEPVTEKIEKEPEPEDTKEDPEPVASESETTPEEPKAEEEAPKPKKKKKAAKKKVAKKKKSTKKSEE